MALRDVYRAAASAEHPNWEEYDEAMRDDGRVAIVVAPEHGVRDAGVGGGLATRPLQEGGGPWCHGHRDSVRLTSPRLRCVGEAYHGALLQRPRSRLA